MSSLLSMMLLMAGIFVICTRSGHKIKETWMQFIHPIINSPRLIFFSVMAITDMFCGTLHVDTAVTVSSQYEK